MVDGHNPYVFIENLIRIIDNSGYFKNVNYYRSGVPNEPKFPSVFIITEGVLTSGKVGALLDLTDTNITIMYAEKSATNKIEERFIVLHDLFRTDNTLKNESGEPTCDTIKEIRFQIGSSERALDLGEGVEYFVMILSIPITYTFT